MKIRGDVEYLIKLCKDHNLIYLDKYWDRDKNRPRLKIKALHKYGELCIDFISLKEHGTPTIKSAVNKNEYFINQYYDCFPHSKNKFPNLNYIDSRTKINVECEFGHIITRTPSGLMQGRGCIECQRLQNTQPLDLFKIFCTRNFNGFGTFYIIKCFNETEEFYKLGITSRSIKDRYNDKIRMPYQYDIIVELEDNPELIFNLELLLKSYIVNQGIKYNPKIVFGGSSTECYKL